MRKKISSLLLLSLFTGCGPSVPTTEPVTSKVEHANSNSSASEPIAANHSNLSVVRLAATYLAEQNCTAIHLLGKDAANTAYKKELAGLALTCWQQAFPGDRWRIRKLAARGVNLLQILAVPGGDSTQEMRDSGGIEIQLLLTAPIADKENCTLTKAHQHPCRPGGYVERSAWEPNAGSPWQWALPSRPPSPPQPPFDVSVNDCPNEKRLDGFRYCDITQGWSVDIRDESTRLEREQGEWASIKFTKLYRPSDGTVTSEMLKKATSAPPPLKRIFIKGKSITQLDRTAERLAVLSCRHLDVYRWREEELLGEITFDDCIEPTPGLDEYVAFSPDGNTIGVMRGGVLTFWDSHDLSRQFIVDDGYYGDAPYGIGTYSPMVFSPDGKSVALVRPLDIEVRNLKGDVQWDLHLDPMTFVGEEYVAPYGDDPPESRVGVIGHIALSVAQNQHDIEVRTLADGQLQGLLRLDGNMLNFITPIGVERIPLRTADSPIPTRPEPKKSPSPARALWRLVINNELPTY